MIMSKMVEIKMTKCLLLIPETLIWNYIPQGELKAGIERGKRRLRGEAVGEREAAKVRESM